jgi:isocitrate lyase
MDAEAQALEEEWRSPRYTGVIRPYSAQTVIRLRGSLRLSYTLAEQGARRLWTLLQQRPYLPALGAVTGNQAVQQVKAGLEAIYVSGWQVAADANLAGETFPDQSLYPSNSVPALVRRINRALVRADEIECLENEGKPLRHWFVPIVADAEAGFGGPLNVFELTRALIEAGAAGVHLEDQLAAEKKCGHMGGKVLIPTGQAIRNLVAARLAMDVLGVSTLLIARTDANGAALLTSDADSRDRRFLTGERTPEGFWRVRPGIEAAIARAVAYAPYADMLWCETAEPDLDEAAEFARRVHEAYPGKLLAYNCSPSFNWRRRWDARGLERFQATLAELGYKFQFVTLAGFHALNLSMFELASGYLERGMEAYAELQAREFALEGRGYTAVRHQREVGAGYFDEVASAIANGEASTLALKGSTEEAQFHPHPLQSGQR